MRLPGDDQARDRPATDRVIVVDNASGDQSVQQISNRIHDQQWNQWARVVPADRNGGFSYGNNLGIRSIEAQYYMLLNSDTLVRPGSIEQMLAATKLHPQAGIIGPRLEWTDRTPQQSCFRDFQPSHEFFSAAGTGALEKLMRYKPLALDISDEPLTCDWTSFACALIPQRVIEKVGLLDEGYFMYFDDADYCRRIREAGYEVLNWPAAHVVHLRGGSGPVKQLTAERKRRPNYWYASRNRYYAKFYGRIGLVAANLCWHAGRLVALAREITKTKQPHSCRREWRDIWTNIRNPLGVTRR